MPQEADAARFYVCMRDAPDGRTQRASMFACLRRARIANRETVPSSLAPRPGRAMPPAPASHAAPMPSEAIKVAVGLALATAVEELLAAAHQIIEVRILMLWGSSCGVFLMPGEQFLRFFVVLQTGLNID